MKWLEAQKVPRQNIIDGRIFKVPNFDFPRFLSEGVVHGVIEDAENFGCKPATVYPSAYKMRDRISTITLGKKSYISSAATDGIGTITVGNFSAISYKELFELGTNNLHDYNRLSSFDLSCFDWGFPSEALSILGKCRIEIGSDVWIGRGCILKCTNPEKPLVIGDGAVIAADSVVVKSVPPYAIVGGNPARIIKYRFFGDIIDALLRIKWWDWDLDKIYENFQYFNNVEEFVELHDK